MPTNSTTSLIDAPRAVRWTLATLVAVSSLAAPTSSLAGQTVTDSDWERVAAEHRRHVTEVGIVGSSLALVENGRITRSQYLGMADLDRDRRVDAETLYHWASITKTFTGVAVMQLRDRGLLRLDDPIVDYVPELREVHNPFGEMDEVTVRHLLSHSAGFRGSTFPWDGGESWQPWEPPGWTNLAAMMPWTQVEFEPGSRFQYSNPGIVFLGRLIEAVTGDVFEAYVEKNVFRPLGMSSAYFDGTPWHLAEHRAENYRVVENQPVANGDFNTGVTVSNGGLNGAVADLARWIAFLTGAVEAGSPAAEVLSRSSLHEMWQEVVPVGDMSLGRERMGLTFWLYPDHGWVGHTGSQRSFFSFILFDPDGRRGIIAAFNTAGGDATGPDTRAILNELREIAAMTLLGSHPS